MKTVGLVTEYNPFHNGHLYHIKKAKEVTQADFCVVVMSGDFIQRGAPAVTDKYTRTKMALLGGADLVIELPVSYATASAERFAYGAVSLLTDTGIVDTLCFGSESGEITPFLTAAAHLTNESGAFVKALQDGLKSGLSFPAARKQALSLIDKETADLLQTPNNILGVEYVKALSRLNSSIIPYTIKREGSAYHADTLTGYLDSASAIRKLLLSNDSSSDSFEILKNSLPDSCFPLLKEQAQKNAFLCEDDFSQLLFYRLLQESFETLTQYQDMSDDLAKRICNRFGDFSSFSDFTATLKTKEVTYTRLSRALLHLVLGLKKENMSDTPSYIRILGFNRQASPLLHQMKEQASLPVISRPAAADSILSGSAKEEYAQNISASNLYNYMQAAKSGGSCIQEYRRQMIIL